MHLADSGEACIDTELGCCFDDKALEQVGHVCSLFSKTISAETAKYWQTHDYGLFEMSAGPSNTIEKKE